MRLPVAAQWNSRSALRQAAPQRLWCFAPDLIMYGMLEDCPPRKNAAHIERTTIPPYNSGKLSVLVQ